MANWCSCVGIYGQKHVKRAREVAAAGGRNILMVRPPGSGKALLACTHQRVLKLNQTIVDLGRQGAIQVALLAEAFQHRPIRME